MHGKRRFGLLLAFLFFAAACGGKDSDGEADGDADADADDDGASDVQPDGLDPAGDDGGDPPPDPADDDGPPPACNMEAAAPPWPDWVPAWPGSGRNATGHTTFRFLGSGPQITDLGTEDVGATSAVVTWTTPGEADSSAAWGTSSGDCSTGYSRTGGRIVHRMVIAPLQPGTRYYVTVRSRDDASEDWGELDFTTPALPTAVDVTECREIGSNGTYRLTADVTADCTCFDITAASVTLDLNRHTVTYAETSTSEQCFGVSARADNVRVTNGTIMQGSAGGDLYSHAVTGRGADGLEFDRLWLYVHAADAFGLRTMYAGSVTVHDVLLVSDVRDVTDRHYPGNRGIALDLSPEDAVGEIYDCILFNVPHWGIMMTADDRLETRPSGGQTRHVWNNHVFAHMHATNGYGIGAHANHMEIDHNEIRPLYNGRALHNTRSNAYIHHNIIEALELIAGDEADGYAYYSDLGDPASPHDEGVCSWVVAHGIRVEGGNFGQIAWNEVYVFSLPDVSFGSTGLNINTGEGAQGGNEVHHNQFTAFRADGSITCSGGPVHTVAGWVWGEPPVEPADLHDNVFASNGDILDIEDAALAVSTNNEELGL